MSAWWAQMWPQVFPNLIASLLWAPIGAALGGLVLWVYHRWFNKAHLARVEAATERVHQAAHRLEVALTTMGPEKVEEEA